MNQAAGAGNAYLEIQTAARQMPELDLPYMDLEEARAMCQQRLKNDPLAAVEN